MLCLKGGVSGDKVLGLEVAFFSVLGVGISAMAFWFFPEIEWLFR